MKRILHMTPPEVSNGVYRYIFNHMPYIDQSKYEFCFLTKSEEELKQSPEYRKYHFPIYKFKNVQREGRETFENEIRSILNDGFDAIHLHTSAWRGFMIEEIAMSMGIKRVIVHSHSTGVDSVNDEERKKILEEHDYYKEHFSMQYATDLCACSNLAADWLFSARIPRDRIRILPNAIDVKGYLFNRAKREKMRCQLGIESRIVLGNVGRYSYTKNQDFLVKCFQKALQKNVKLFLILIGQGDKIQEIRQLVKELGIENDVKCLGWENNISDYLQAMDIFCLPSKFEGLPISAIEAQASGLQCLISDQVTKEVDITGNIRFLPLCMEAWVDSLATVSNDYERFNMNDMIRNAGFNVEEAANRLLELYN